MHRSSLVFAALAYVLPSTPAAARPKLIAATLIAKTMSPRPGHSVLVGLRMTPQPGWHGYWSNPGDSGLAPVVKWTAPPGVHFGPLRHPAPSLLRVMGVTSYVHAGPHVLISRMTVDPGLTPGTPLPITTEVSWAACSDKLCVPERATLSLPMTVGDGAPSAQAVLVRRAAAAEPREAGTGKFVVRDRKLLLLLPGNVRVDARRARFFPDENGFLDAGEAQVRDGPPLRIQAPVKGDVPTRFSGVVSDGATAYRLIFRRGAVPGDRETIAEPAPPHRIQASASPSAAALVAAGDKQRPSRPAPARSAIPIAMAGLCLASMTGLALLVRKNGRR